MLLKSHRLKAMESHQSIFLLKLEKITSDGCNRAGAQTPVCEMLLFMELLCIKRKPLLSPTLHAYEEFGAWNSSWCWFFHCHFQGFFTLARNSCLHRCQPTKEENTAGVNLGHQEICHFLVLSTAALDRSLPVPL